MNKFQTSWIEISRSALKENYDFIRTQMLDGVTLSSVVKGNAYGHGISTFVPLVEQNGVDHFSVFSADEASKVKEVCSDASGVMIMGMIENDHIPWAIENDVEFYVFDFDRLEATIRHASAMNKKAMIHIELETGMHRTGFEEESIPRIQELLIKNRDYLILKGICTHYAGAESIANYYRIQQQQEKFNKYSSSFEMRGLIPHKYHSACSAASLKFPGTQMDLVRLGIIQYGFFPTKEVLIDYMIKNETQVNPLRRVLSWKSRVMDVKHVRPGEFIGYGTSYIAHTDQKIATIPVGYGNGFSRSLSNQGRVLINGERVSVIGMVNMNMISVDVTNLEHVKKGDEVVMIGQQGDMEITVASFSEFSEQVNYELLTRLPSNIERKIID